MAFVYDNLAIISNLATDQTPNLYSYYSGTDTIDVVLSTTNYFALGSNAALSANSNRQLFNSGDKIFMVDANGNEYELVVSTTTGNNVTNISLLSQNGVLLQSKITTLSAAQTIYDLPPAGYITKIQAVLDAAITGAANTVTISQGSNAIATITVNTTDVAGQIYNPTLTTNTAYRKFDGNTPLKIASAGTGTGTSALKILTNIVAAAR